MILKSIVIAAAFAGSSLMAGSTLTSSEAAANTNTDVVQAAIQKYGLATGETGRRACVLIEEEPGGTCIYSCDGVWCLAECTDRFPNCL